MIPESFIQELINRVDIVDVIDKYVPLKKAGANYSACCPFHNEKSPSFTVSPTKQFYHCFGCGVHGTAIGFLMEYQGLSFVDSVSELAKLVGLNVPQESTNELRVHKNEAIGMYEALQEALKYYRAELKNSSLAIEYLKKRGLSGEIAARFQIGYAPANWQNLESVFIDYKSDVLQTVGLVVTNEQGKRYDRFRDRIMFPIHDLKGQVIGFGGRVLTSARDEDGPKYLNSPETPLFQKGTELYGLFLARKAIKESGVALVVEGYMDVVALAQYGVEYCVATLGTATTPFHIKKLMRQTDQIVFCFDGDSAGRKAAWRAAQNSLPALTDGLKLSFLFLPPEHDPDSYIRAYGKSAFESEIKQALPLSQYLIQQLTVNNSLQSQEDKVRFLNDSETLLKQITAPRLSLLLKKRISELAEVSSQEFDAMIKLPKNQQPKSALPREVRKTVSLQRRFVLMALMRPDLVDESDLKWISDFGQEDILLREVIQIIRKYPDSKPAAILYQLETTVQGQLIREIERELHFLDESLDFALEFHGARKQLKEMYQQRSNSLLLEQLKEKSLSQLTDAERALLKEMGANNK